MPRPTAHTIVLPGLALCLVLAGGVSVRAADIQLKSRVVSRGSLILLGDVAEISGQNASQVRTLERMELVLAPSRGGSRTLRRREIRELIQLRGVDPRHHQIAGADAVHIAPRLRQPKEKPQLVPAPAPAPAAPQQWYVSAVRPLARGHIVRAGDVELRPQTQQRQLGSRVIQAIDQVVDHELTRPLQPGRPVESGMIRRPLLIRQNEVISVVSRSAGIRVQTTAKATQDGALGDLIVVQKLNSREKYTARVSGSKLAEVFASGVVVSSPPPPRRRELRRTTSRSPQP